MRAGRITSSISCSDLAALQHCCRFPGSGRGFRDGSGWVRVWVQGAGGSGSGSRWVWVRVWVQVGLGPGLGPAGSGSGSGWVQGWVRVWVRVWVQVGLGPGGSGSGSGPGSRSGSGSGSGSGSRWVQVGLGPGPCGSGSEWAQGQAHTNHMGNCCRLPGSCWPRLGGKVRTASAQPVHHAASIWQILFP